MDTLPRPVLPGRIKKPEWYKGLLVARNVKRDEAGTPLFGQVDSDWVTEVAWPNRLCQTCGQRIASRDPVILPGGPHDITYQEAPMHPECARYSALVCPRILSKRDTFTFHVAQRYEMLNFWDAPTEDPQEAMAIRPLPLNKRSNLYMNLYFAHCDTCHEDPGHALNRLNWDCFMRWTR